MVKTQKDLLAHSVDIVVITLYLDFGHFCVRIRTRRRFMQFQAIYVPTGTGVREFFSRIQSDIERFAELAKVQLYKTGLKRQKALVLTNRTPVLPWEPPKPMSQRKWLADEHTTAFPRHVLSSSFGSLKGLPTAGHAILWNR